MGTEGAGSATRRESLPGAGGATRRESLPGAGLMSARVATSTSRRESLSTGSKYSKASHVYRIVIAIVGIFFLAETIGNGLVLLRLRDTDLQGGEGIFFPRSWDKPSSSLASGDDVRFVPRVLLSRGGVDELRKESSTRSRVRPPRVALVCPNLTPSPLSLYIVTIATALQELGYNLEVHTLKDGQLRHTWESIGIPVKVVEVIFENVTTVNWLKYEGVIAFSLNAKPVVDSLAQEPFTNVPVLWAITDDTLGRRLGDYKSASNLTELISNWRLSFQRADVLVFPDYSLPLIYTMLDAGNFFVIPGSPAEVWTAEEYKLTHSQASLRAQYLVRPEDLVVAVVGSPFLYHGSWREHALVMRALARAHSRVGASSPNGGRRIQLLVFGNGNHSSSYGDALQVLAKHVGLENSTVRHVGAGEDVTGMLWMSDVVVYGSIRDEQAFPPILSRAMSLQRPVIAPNRTAFREQIVDGENGVLFPVGDDMKLSDAIVRVLKDESTGSAMAVSGQFKARNMFTSSVSLRFGEILESVVEFPVEAELPRPLDEAMKKLRPGWRWDVLFPASFPFRDYSQSRRVAEDDVGSGIVKLLEDEWMLRVAEAQILEVQNSTEVVRPRTYTYTPDLELPNAFDLEEAKALAKDLAAQKIEWEELDSRKELVQTPLEDITKLIRKTEVRRDELKERSDVQIQRGAQPLCIYEPYHGRGSWPFLHEESTLYRGLSLSTVDRRSGDDDVDAEVRLPGLLNDTYYRNVLCEFGAFLAIANRIDRIHKNPWIGFQPWRTSSEDVALTTVAEAALTDAVTIGKHGDALYFWARNTDDHVGKSSGDSSKDFWAYCDSITSGQCREAFTSSWRHIYDLPSTWDALPPMPADGGAWSALHSWVMPTPSFVEFVLFARVFVDALDARYYEEHHNKGQCRFTKFHREDKYCYCRLLEGLVNVWAYHSARRMIYVDPKTGVMEEQHVLESRRGKMWIQYLTLETLKGMDEDLAQAADDSDFPGDRWLWPLTGEVYWEGIFERERQERWRRREERMQKQKEKQALIRSRTKFQAIH